MDKKDQKVVTMNRKIISVLLILLAFSLTLGAVSAEDVANEDAVAADDAVVLGADKTLLADEQAAETEAPAVEATADTESADLAIDVEQIDETEDGEIIWSVVVTNYGPDTAENAFSLINVAPGLGVFEYLTTHGEYDSELSLWVIGDLAKDEQALLLLGTFIIDEGPYYVEAIVLSDTDDPDFSNNYDIAYYGEASAAEEPATLENHVTGNPIAMALLALLAVGIGGITRRF